MKLSEIDENTVIDAVALRLPEDVLEEFKDYCGGEPVMYYCGPVMGYGSMMSPQPPGTKGERRLYPFPPSVNTSDMLDWEIEDGKHPGQD